MPAKKNVNGSEDSKPSTSKTPKKAAQAKMTRLNEEDVNGIRARKYEAAGKEMTLFQRTYWVRPEDSIAMDDIKNAILRRGDLVSVDLSTVVRGAVTYVNEIRQDPTRRAEWEEIVKVLVAAKNPKRPGPNN